MGNMAPGTMSTAKLVPTGKARVTKPATGPATGDPIKDSIFALVPETVDAFSALNRAVWHSDAVRPSLLEMLRMRNARTVNCVFCRSVRYDAAREDGLTEDRVQQIEDGHQNSSLPEIEKAALAFADLYLLKPKGLTPDLKRRLEGHFSERQIAQMAVAIATFNATSRCAVSIGGMPESLPVMEIQIPR